MLHLRLYTCACHVHVHVHAMHMHMHMHMSRACCMLHAACCMLHGRLLVEGLEELLDGGGCQGGARLAVDVLE